MALTLLISPALAASASAQVVVTSPREKAAIELSAQAGAMARAIETRVTKNAPYSGEATTEFVQSLADGNRIVRRTSTRLYRDSEGRTRREVTESSGAGDATSTVITDPVAGVSIMLDQNTRSAHKMPAMFATFGKASVLAGGKGEVTIVRGGPDGATLQWSSHSGSEHAADHEKVSRALIHSKLDAVKTDIKVIAEKMQGQTTREDLGQQTMEGVTVEGVRSTTVIPAGAIGNEAAITIVSEQWFSPALQVLVMTRHNDPRVGETTYRLTNIERTEPDKSLFQVPSDYTVENPKLIRKPLFDQE